MPEGLIILVLSLVFSGGIALVFYNVGYNRGWDEGFTDCEKVTHEVIDKSLKT